MDGHASVNSALSANDSKTGISEMEEKTSGTPLHTSLSTQSDSAKECVLAADDYILPAPRLAVVFT